MWEKKGCRHRIASHRIASHRIALVSQLGAGGNGAVEQNAASAAVPPAERGHWSPNSLHPLLVQRIHHRYPGLYIHPSTLQSALLINVKADLQQETFTFVHYDDAMLCALFIFFLLLLCTGLRTGHLQPILRRRDCDGEPWTACNGRRSLGRCV